MNMNFNKNLIYRRAKVEDIKNVKQMIQELADFEKMSEGPKLTEDDLIRDSGLDGGREYCHICILELKDENSEKIIPIGYTICFFCYSTWQGRSYFLEDIYVKPEFRKMGAGARLFREVAATARSYGCKRLDFHVLSWNPARTFYEKMGAVDLTEKEQWHYYRMEENAINKLAAKINK